MSSVISPTLRRQQMLRKENFSLDEAAHLLCLTHYEVDQLVARQKLRGYRLSGWPELRVTRHDLFEYSLISGKRLSN